MRHLDVHLGLDELKSFRFQKYHDDLDDLDRNTIGFEFRVWRSHDSGLPGATNPGNALAPLLDK